MSAKDLPEFVAWYRKKWGFDPEPISIWGAAIKFAEEKFNSSASTPSQQAKAAIALVKSLHVWCERGYFPSKWYADNKRKLQRAAIG